MSVGKSVRLFLADGTPGGLLTAEIMNWTGHVVAAPVPIWRRCLKRPEASRTGIYILLGDDPDSLGGRWHTSAKATMSASVCISTLVRKTRMARTSGIEPSCSPARTPTSPRRTPATWRVASDHSCLSRLTAPSSTTARHRHRSRCLRPTSPTWSTSSSRPRSCCRCSA